MLSLALAISMAIPSPAPQSATQVAGPVRKQHQIAIRYPHFDKLYCATVDPNYCDTYYIDGPPLQPGTKYPLVIMFHGYGERADEVLSRNGNGWYPGARAFMDACKSWTQGPKPYIVVMHDGGKSSYGTPPVETFNTYGTEEFMRATEAVLTDVVNKWPIDRKRMYGYGLSMGGGECLAYAARHQDPKSKTMLSAVCNHSGTVSISRIYHTAAPVGKTAWESLLNTVPYGTSPAGDFPFQRCSAMDLPFDATFADPLDHVLKSDFHLANNLRWLPRMNFHVTSPPDHLKHMVEPIQALEDFLQNPALVNAPDQVAFPPVANNVHNWSAIAPADILTYFDARKKADTLALFSTQLPSSGSNVPELMLFAEDDTRHHCFSVVRQNPNLWGRLHVKFWKPYFPTTNALALIYDADNATDNIAELTIWVDQHLTHLDWSDTPGNRVVLAASGVDLGTIHCEGAPAPASVEQLVSGSWIPANTPADWVHGGSSLVLYEDPVTQLQRQWRVNY